MAHFLYERVDAKRRQACVVMTPVALHGLGGLPEGIELPGEGDEEDLRQLGAFDSDDTATAFFVKYLAKLSEPSWQVFPCYVGADLRFRRFARL